MHGPHDEKFYKYLDGLQDEYDALQRSGYAGEGFFSEGKRLGENISHNVPQHLARQKALEAAEKRAKTSRVLGSGGRLGGSARNAGLSPRELAARAAEKRIRDEKACASGEEAKREAEKAAKSSVTNPAIDLNTDEAGSGSDSDVVIVKDLHPRPNKPVNPVVGSSKGNTSTPAVQKDAKKLAPPSPVARIPPTSLKRTTPSMTPNIPAKKRQTMGSDETANWTCPACTLINARDALQCDVCQMHKPNNGREGWTCLECGELGNPHEHWTCRSCGEVKLFS